MNDPRIRQDPVDQPSEQEVGGHLVDDTAMLRRKWPNFLEILLAKSRLVLRPESRSRCGIQSGLGDGRLQRRQLACTENVSMRRKYLFYKRSTGSRHPDDEHRQRTALRSRPGALQSLGRKCSDDFVDPAIGCCRIIGEIGTFTTIAFIQMRKPTLGIPRVEPGFTQREMQCGTVCPALDASSREQAFHRRNPWIAGLEPVEIGKIEPRRDRAWIARQDVFEHGFSVAFVTLFHQRDCAIYQCLFRRKAGRPGGALERCQRFRQFVLGLEDFA